MHFLDKTFRLSESHTTIRTEILAGVTTFMTMSYIIFVQPAVLSTTGMDFQAVLASTCIVSAIGCFLMALLANYPIAVAPAMGHNFFFAFTVVATMHYTWQVALGAVFISGVAFLLMSFWGVREALVHAIPDSLKRGIAVGIGLLITLVGLEWSGFLAASPATLVSLGDLHHPSVWMSATGIVITSVLLVRRSRGAILAGIVTSTALGLFFGIVRFHGIFSSPPSITPVALKLDVAGAFKLGAIPVIFIFFFLDLFDSIGSLIGIAEQGGFIRDGQLPRAREALLADAIGTSVSALAGNSTLVSYIESAAGVAEGGKTGLANIVTGLLMLLGLFLAPVAQMIGEGYKNAAGLTLYPTVAPALIVVGAFMMRNVARIDWDDPLEYIPAFVTLAFIPFTFSITDGIAFGFISYVALSVIAGKYRKLHWLMVLFTLLFLIRYAAI
ncbi:MAG: guanine permease [Acidobacteria bacterium]|nr:MAG: guanine permease [Acidobacteriota bacterium]